jgi:hypothetical protein
MNEQELIAFMKEEKFHKLENLQKAKDTLGLYKESSESVGIYDKRQDRMSKIKGEVTDYMDSRTPAQPQFDKIKGKIIRPIHYDKNHLTCYDVLDFFNELKNENLPRLIGLLSHFVYWVVFGIVNTSPLSNFHLKQLFISIMQAISDIEKRQDKKKLFACFIMPLLLLTIRLEVESIYRNAYR